MQELQEEVKAWDGDEEYDENIRKVIEGEEEEQAEEGVENGNEGEGENFEREEKEEGEEEKKEEEEGEEEKKEGEEEAEGEEENKEGEEEGEEEKQEGEEEAEGEEEEEEDEIIFPDVQKSQLGLGGYEDKDHHSYKIKMDLFYARRKFTGLLVACVIFQLSLSSFILIDAEETGFTEPPNVEIGFSRFVAAMVMHIVTNDEIYNGMKMMKYSINHPWKFSNPYMAFTSGFLQVFSMGLISLINYLVIAQSGTVLEIA